LVENRKKSLTLNQTKGIISSMKTIVLISRMHKQLPQVAGWNCARNLFTVEGSGYAIESDSGGFGKLM
jgi:hypothetical protein